jgi:hypothetical protein
MEKNTNELIIAAPRKDTSYKNSFDMSFVSKDNIQVCAGTGCRDYLHDIIRTFLNNKERLGADGHNYYPELGDPDLCMDKLRLLLKLANSNEKAARTNIKRAVKMLNILEVFSGIQKTKMTFVSVEKPKEKELCVLLEGSEEYMHNPHLLSLLTLVVRFTYFNKIKVVDENSLYNSHMGTNKDRMLMNSCHKIIHLVLKNRKELFDGISLEELFPTRIGYNFHSKGGIQSLCDSESSNDEVNRKIRLLKKSVKEVEE